MESIVDKDARVKIMQILLILIAIIAFVFCLPVFKYSFDTWQEKWETPQEKIIREKNLKDYLERK